jgi:hypothetical protein
MQHQVMVVAHLAMRQHLGAKSLHRLRDNP